MGSPSPGRQMELMMEGKGLVVCFSCRVLVQRAKRVFQKYSLRGSWFFFFCSYETGKSNTIAIKRRATLPMVSCQFSLTSSYVGAFTHRSRFCSLLHGPASPRCFLGLLHSKLPGLWESQNAKDKELQDIQKAWFLFRDFFPHFPSCLQWRNSTNQRT